MKRESDWVAFEAMLDNYQNLVRTQLVCRPT
jgi:hypothetical protein